MCGLTQNKLIPANLTQLEVGYVLIAEKKTERIIGFWLVTSFRPRTVQFVSSPFMIDKCPLCLDHNCKAAEYMTTASVCSLQNGIFCPWQQGHTFVWLFGGEGYTPPPLCRCWNGHFVFVYLMWAVKLQGRDKGNCPMEQQQQLSVCLPLHVFMAHRPPHANCVAEMCVLCWFGKIWTEEHQLTFENAWNVSYSCLRLTCGWVGLRICPKK